jgi:hypothetical protein
MRPEAALRRLAVGLGVVLAVGGCGGGGRSAPPARPASLTGSAVLDLTLVTAPIVLNEPQVPPDVPGFTVLDVDLNESTGGDYVWLYGRIGPADGSAGTPLGELYTVDATAGEKLRSGQDTELPVNLNSSTPVVGHEIHLAFRHSSWPVVRCVAVADVNDQYDTQIIRYLPPEAEGSYPVVWVQERISKDLHTVPAGPWGSDPQDLNEGTSLIIPPLVFDITDYIYVGYCLDQAYYDWLQHR